MYSDIIKEQFKTGIIEKVNLNFKNNNPIFYLPHQPVFRNDKLRIVFDASAKPLKASRALNELLDPGSQTLENLGEIMLRYRCFPYVVACDVEKAFLQISINEKD